MSVTVARVEPSIAGAGDYIELMKPRVMSLVVFTALVGLYVAPGHIHPVMAGAALLCIAVGAGAAGALNMWYDADIDAKMARTAGRPIPRGHIAPGDAAAFGMTLAAFSIVTLGVLINWFSAALLAFTIFFYVVIYTMWLKRSTAQNIVIGGAAGAVPVLVGWSSVTDRLSVAPFILFGVIFLWTPPHFWALAVRYREDYAAAKIPMLPVVADISKVAREIIAYTVATALLSLSFGPVAHLNWGYEASALLLGALFCWKAIALWRSPDAKHAMRLFAYSISYLTLLFIAMGIDAIVQHP